ncbi:hypothetical protein FB567DRAFT_549048 [Paraphoma chrysanthemicola]|uniref:Mesaconyl-C4 CoA hydratase n=1 Tax=Paraphoma chrysanthemicola TaxID=798071 RepID=A0A8K0VZB3_9PLEO|nr:hypothetical protein FB567DRAFT_549048 [Paraphoma chrysanthemicola]
MTASHLMSPYTQCFSRIARTRLRPLQWRRLPARCYATSTADDPPWFQKLRTEMLGRDAISSREFIDENVEHKLTDTLSTFLPPDWCTRVNGKGKVVPVGHHLVWFNTSMPVDKLLPDGTDPLQSPGDPWVRRMWAGGSLKIRPKAYYDPGSGFTIDNYVICAEHISDVQLRGQGDAAKIFVTIERKFARHEILRDKHAAWSKKTRGTGPQSYFRQQIKSEGWGDAVLVEQRNLVFLKDKTPAELEAIAAGDMAPIRYLKPPGEPEFSYTLTPTRTLLFRYSALTFNAHLIHLDREYARNIEGHRNLLVHGPLSLTLMLQAMSAHIKTKSQGSQVLESIEYRNLAPLYCDEEMRICGRRRENSASGSWVFDIWIEGPSGGVAVKGTVLTSNDLKSGAQWTIEKPEGSTNIRFVTAPGENVQANVSSKGKRDRSSRGKQGQATPVRYTYRSPTDVAPDRSSLDGQGSELIIPKAARSAASTKATSEVPTASLSTFSLPPAPETAQFSSTNSTSSNDSSSQSSTTGSRDVGHAHRRNMPRRASSYAQSKSNIASTFRRVLAPPPPMKRAVSLRTRILLQRSARVVSNLNYNPVPIIRKYRGKQYIYDPSRVARRHSRFERDGVRAFYKPRIVKSKTALGRSVS